MSAESSVERRDRVVVGVDGSPASIAATRWAATAAEAQGLPLHLVHAFAWPAPHHYFGGGLAEPYSGAIGEPYGDQLRQATEAMLADAAAKVRSEHPGLRVSTEVAIGPPARELIDASGSAALVVVGSRGLGGFAGLLVGSVGTQLGAHAACPVVVVMHGAEAGRASDGGSSAGHVVLGVDSPTESDAAIEFAFAAAARTSAALTALHAWAVPPDTGAGSAAPQRYDVSAITADETRRLAERLAPWREKYPAVDVRSLVRHGQPAAALIAESADAELLVVGSHGHSALHNLFLGSTCNTVLHHAGCPVAIVPTRRRGRAGGPF